MLTTIQKMKTENWNADYRTWLVGQNVSAKTIDAYEADLRVFCRWFYLVNREEFAPELINSTDMRSFRQWSLEVERVSPATWNRRRASLINLCQFSEETYHLKLFRMNSIPRAEECELAPKWLPQQETRRIMRELELEINGSNTDKRRMLAIRDQAMVGLMLYAGLRISEVLALQVQDVVLGERKGAVNIRGGKGGVYATVPLSTSARVLLRAWLEIRPAGNELLFCGIKPRGVQKRLAELSARLGIDGLHAHALRHSCAKNALDASNGHLTEVQKLMRHKRITTTTRYTTPSMGDLEELVEIGELGKINQLMEVR